MNPVTALCVMLAGAAIVLPRTNTNAPARMLKAALAAVVGAIALARLAAVVAGADASVDQLLFPEQVLGPPPSRMAPNTAVALLLVGAGVGFTAMHARWSIYAAQLAAAGAAVIATAGLIGYALGAPRLYSVGANAIMSFPTAVTIVVAALGLLAVRPAQAVSGIVTNRTLGGATARWLLPLAFAAIVASAEIRVALARRHLVDEVTGVALLTTATLVTMVVVVLLLAAGLRKVSLTLAAREATLIAAAAELAAARDAADSAARVKADFIANMSHEIRTPLTAIVGYAERLARRGNLDPIAQREVGRIDIAAQALLAIVNDVLDFSKLEAGRVTLRPGPVDPARLFGETLRLFEEQAAAKGLALDFRSEDALPPWLLLDADRVRQVLMNLLGNAVKFTDQGGVRLRVRYEAASNRLTARIEDSGPGLDAAQQRRLFQRFSQVDASDGPRFGGTGLGLAICKGLVEAMEGEIGVDSHLGVGSTFHFSIPAPRAAGHSAGSASSVHQRLAGVRILLVDDDPSNRELAGDALRALGATVVDADGGEAGVSAAGEPFDVILMDLRMPGLDGRAATAAIRAGDGPNRSTPILAFSANLGEPAAAPEGFNGFVRKPFSPAGLAAAVAACLPEPAP